MEGTDNACRAVLCHKALFAEVREDDWKEFPAGRGQQLFEYAPGVNQNAERDGCESFDRLSLQIIA